MGFHSPELAAWSSTVFSPAVERQVLACMDFMAEETTEWIKDLLRVALGSVMASFSNYSRARPRHRKRRCLNSADGNPRIGWSSVLRSGMILRRRIPRIERSSFPEWRRYSARHVFSPCCQRRTGEPSRERSAQETPLPANLSGWNASCLSQLLFPLALIYALRRIASCEMAGGAHKSACESSRLARDPAGTHSPELTPCMQACALTDSIRSRR